MAYFYPKSLEWRADTKCSVVELDKKKKFFFKLSLHEYKECKTKKKNLNKLFFVHLHMY